MDFTDFIFHDEVV